MGMNNRSGKCPKCRSTDVRVAHRLHNHSAFNGYRQTRSDYSGCYCFTCGYGYRTRADYVSGLPDMTERDWDRIPSLRMELWL